MSKKKKKVNILEHELVPEHEVLSPSDTKAVLKKFGIKKEQLPTIYQKDSVIKKIKAKVGDVIKITRKSETAGKTTYYRQVVEEV